MPHRGLHDLNTAIREASSISEFYQKRYLNPTGNCPNIKPVVVTQDSMFYRLSGYDHYGATSENDETVQRLTMQMIGAINTAGNCLSYTILSEVSGIKIYYGTQYQTAEIIKRGLSMALPKASVNNDWIRPDILRNYQKFGAFIVGSGVLKPSNIDQALSTLDNSAFMVSVFARPIPRNELDREAELTNQLTERLQKVEHVENFYGGQRRRTSSSRNMDVVDALDTLGLIKQRLELGRQTGLWETTVFVSAPTAPELSRCAQVVSTLFFSSTEHSVDSAPSVIWCSAPFIEQCRWNIPGVNLFRNPMPGLYGKSLVNILTTEDLAAIVSPPKKEHRGYSVRHLGDSARSILPFSSFSPSSDGFPSIGLGTLHTNEPFSIRIDDLRQHVLVTGAPQYGKTTTVKRILAGAISTNIPFLVIESAKKDYWRMKKFAGMHKLRVYSGGNDGLPLRINPFQPEVGTTLEYHIQGLIAVFLALFEGEDPIPQIIQELVYMAYEKLGWDTKTRITGKEEKQYPIISDMLANLDECIETIGYDKEVKQRMRGVMNIRGKSLLRLAGTAFNTTQNISAEELFRTSSIVELDDYTSETLPFVSSLLALKVREYSRTQPLIARLRRLLILEEAHNILPNPELPNSSNSRATCAEYFTNMLAEVSGYGTGVIVVDQRPSKIASGAIANTGLKIVHTLHESEDINAIFPSLSFSESVRNSIPQLSIGQAIISLPNASSLYTVLISPLSDIDSNHHLGCLFCKKDVCDSCSSMITMYEQNIIRAAGVSAGSLQGCIRSIQNRQGRVLSCDEVMCLAGNMCRFENSISDNDQRQRQILYDLYKHQVTR